MNKFRYVLLILVLLLVGCSKKETSTSSIEISLDSNPTTGYEWYYETTEEGIIKATLDNYLPDETEEDIVGSGGIQYFTFEPTKEGNTILVLFYARSWEAEESPLYKLTYNVSVGKDLSIDVSDPVGTYFTEVLPKFSKTNEK